MEKNKIAALLLIVFSLSSIAHSQTPEQERRIEEEKRASIEDPDLELLKKENRLVFDWGGWYNFRYDDYNEDDNDKGRLDGLKETFSNDFRFWVKTTLRPPADGSYQNEHSLYLRVKDAHNVERGGDTNKKHEYDHDGPHLDYGYVVLDLRPLTFEIGRRYYSVGQGIAYSNVNDGAEGTLFIGEWNLKGFASKTLPHEHNVDVSVPGFDKKHERYFYGGEITYLGIRNHGLYLFGVWQDDKSEEDPFDQGQDYRYDSQYLGVGSQGKLLANLHYWSEFIQEFGTSYTTDTNHKQRVVAMAADLGVSYDLNVYSKPNFTFEYAFGSGDSDRRNVTDTLGGNAEGRDHNFLYFGYLPAGYALSARISNIHFIKAGTLIKPFEKVRSLRNLSLGADAYRFYKHKDKGGISDLEATKDGSDIGWELDFTASWEILSDLRGTVEYGHFFPGEVYPADTDKPETYFSISTTFTF